MSKASFHLIVSAFLIAVPFSQIASAWDSRAALKEIPGHAASNAPVDIGNPIFKALGDAAIQLDDFCRGTLEISPPAGFAHAVIDGGGAHLFSYIEAGLRNTTSEEEMGPGVLTAMAGYRLQTNYRADLSTGSPAAGAHESGFCYSVSTPLQIPKLSSIKAEPFTFDFSADPIPVGIANLFIQVVFYGTLGREENRALAQGVTDLNEPQHLVFWNNTDYFLLNGVPRKANQIQTDPDVQDYGHVYPYAFTETIAFASSQEALTSAPVSFVIDNLPPARYSRVIALMPGVSDYWVRDHIISTPSALFPDPVVDNGTWQYTFPGVVNQETSTGQWNNTPVYTVRGVTQHQMTYFLRDYPEFVYTPKAFQPPRENALGSYPVTVRTTAVERWPMEQLTADMAWAVNSNPAWQNMGHESERAQ